MYTIEPSDDDTVKVSTYPANLVTASKQNGNLLQLEFNKDVAYDSNEGGVQIYFPASQLKSVNVAADSVAQILDGFTNIDSLRVSSDAKLYATMLSGSDNKDENDEAYRLRDLSVSSDAQAFVLSNYNIKNVKVSSDGQLTLQSPMVKDVRVSSDAVLKMKGNITSAKVSSDGKLTLDGNVVGDGNVEVTSDAGVTIFGSVSSSTSVRVSSDGNFNVGAELAASVEVTSDGRVRAPNCNTVSTRSDGKCIVDNNINGSVNVSVDTLPLTRKGTEHCGSFSSWQGSRKGKFWSIFGVACAVVVCYVCYRRCKNCPEKATDFVVFSWIERVHRIFCRKPVGRPEETVLPAHATTETTQARSP